MKPVHVNPHHVKKSKELDDNNPNKNARKDPKTIAPLVNEGRFSYPPAFTPKSGVCRICDSIHRRRLLESRTGFPDGLLFISQNTKTFTGI